MGQTQRMLGQQQSEVLHGPTIQSLFVFLLFFYQCSPTEELMMHVRSRGHKTNLHRLIFVGKGFWYFMGVALYKALSRQCNH